MEVKLAAMVYNLTGERADRFDQGCREAAMIVEMLQRPVSSFPAGSSHLVIEGLLVSIGKILEESLKYPNDVARHHALRSVAAALAQALVPSTFKNIGSGSIAGGGNGAEFKDKLRKRNEMEKQINRNNLRNDILDWDAAALLSQSALLAPESNNAFAVRPLSLTLQGNNNAAAADSLPLNTLDALLQLSLHVPSIDAISGKPSTLLKTAQQITLQSDDALAVDRKHSQVGWMAYLTLQPQALDQLLSSVLSYATTCSKTGTKSSIQASIDSNKEWKSGIEAIAATPGLHLAARRTLRAWLAASGNVHVWLLHWYLFRLSNNSNIKLVPYYLYPGSLRNTAECLFEACSNLPQQTENAAIKKADKDLKVLAVALESIRKHPMTEEVFSLLLDGLDMTRAALQQLSCAKEGNQQDEDMDDEESIIEMRNVAYFKVHVAREAAEWLALVMWPFSASQQRLLYDAIIQNTNKSSSGEDAFEEIQQSIFILQNIWCPVFLE